ncbi:UTRA domain-containing protein [Nocardia terpenica]|uniref:UTRA domain-containing protein n=1 Tax=Nocardia terpenica TaxID=455432 RepID=UPI00142DD010|nr:UTRA domain-containing protein [Nocardia terpenica]
MTDITSEWNVIGVRPRAAPGGIYDRLEEAGHGPLDWYEYVTARAATAHETQLLGLRAGVPVQRIIRTSTDPTGLICEVNAISLPADRVEIGYRIERDTPPHTQ